MRDAHYIILYYITIYVIRMYLCMRAGARGET